MCTTCALTAVDSTLAVDLVQSDLVQSELVQSHMFVQDMEFTFLNSVDHAYWRWKKPSVYAA